MNSKIKQRESLWVLVLTCLLVLPATALSKPKAAQCENVKPSQAALRTSFRCNMDLHDAGRSPVLLVPGTTLKPEENFDWNYMPALEAKGWPVCRVELPENALGNIQVAGEHIAYAIKKAHSASGHKVQIIGFSQGGMAPRWALRFSPETRNKVADMISLSGSHHGGVIIGPAFCDPGAAAPDPDGVVGCEAALWQQIPDSNFITTLNKDYEAVPEVDYTAIYTTFDDVLISNGGPTPTSALNASGDNVANIKLQDLCPANAATHRDIGTFDPVGYAIALDALENDGPASLERLLEGGDPGSGAICAEVYMPGVDPAAFDTNAADYDAIVGAALFNGTHLMEEPAPFCNTRGNGPK